MSFTISTTAGPWFSPPPSIPSKNSPEQSAPSAMQRAVTLATGAGPIWPRFQNAGTSKKSMTPTLIPVPVNAAACQSSALVMPTSDPAVGPKASGFSCSGRTSRWTGRRTRAPSSLLSWPIVMAGTRVSITPLGAVSTTVPPADVDGTARRGAVVIRRVDDLDGHVFDESLEMPDVGLDGGKLDSFERIVDGVREWWR